MEGKNNQTYRSLVVLGVVLVLILLSAITPAKWLGIKVKKQPYTKLDLTVITSPSEVAEDTDNDGKVGWNEIVASTFKDSTTTLAIINKKPINQKIIDELNDPNNLTSSFSKNVYLATAYLKEKGITDEKSKQDAVNYLMAQEVAKITMTSYSLKDIRVAKSESKESIKVYGNTIAPLIKNLISSEIVTNDITSIAVFMKTKNEKDINPLIANKKRIDGILKNLLAIEVPSSAITYHILMLNRLALYSDILGNLSKLGSDPVRSTLTIDSYQDVVLLLMRLPSQLSVYFNVQNVVFTTKDIGYIFTSGYTYK